MSGRSDSSETDAPVAIPVVAEELSIDKKLVERRRIRVRKTVGEHTEIARAVLEEDIVEIDRRPVDRIVETAPAIREEGELLIIPVVEEILVVEKRLLLKEEIVVRRHRVSNPFEQEVVLRREEVQVDSVELPSSRDTRS